MEPADRITTYFEACGEGSALDIASHFTPDAVIYDSNVRPIRGAEAIGSMWVTVRDRWGGARWTVDSVIVGPPTGTSEGAAEDAEDAVEAAAIEWSMTGVNPDDGRAFTFRGSEHYRFVDTLIDEIRQYWTFDPDKLDTGLLDYDYEDD